MRYSIYGVFSLWLVATAVHADSFAAGEYITENGWGVMTLTSKQHFAIDTIGGNASTCQLEGNIQHQQAQLKIDDTTSCTVKFVAKGVNIEVSDTESSDCQMNFCGTQAHFAGLYFKVANACTTKEREKTRNKFKQLYQAKAYQAAYATLEPLLRTCEKTLDWLDTGWIRNDLAVAQLHLGWYADCQKTLEPLIAGVAQTGEKLPRTEQGLKEILPPSDFENYLPIAKATWHNWDLCSKKP